jgi:hypothetical protein
LNTSHCFTWKAHKNQPIRLHGRKLKQKDSRVPRAYIFIYYSFYFDAADIGLLYSKVLILIEILCSAISKHKNSGVRAGVLE